MGVYKTYLNTKCCAICEFWGALRRIYGIMWKVRNGEYVQIGGVVIIKEKKDIKIVVADIYAGLL